MLACAVMGGCVLSYPGLPLLFSFASMTLPSSQAFTSIFASNLEASFHFLLPVIFWELYRLIIICGFWGRCAFGLFFCSGYDNLMRGCRLHLRLWIACRYSLYI